MKAVVYYGPGDIRVEERPGPKERNDNIIAKVYCCAICGSDLKMWKSGNPRCNPPRIIGHEMAGEITHVGDKITGFDIGDRITLATTVGCGECYYCKNGMSNVCTNSSPISNATDGAFAEYIEIPCLAVANGNVIKIPDSLRNEWASLSEPLSCAINAQERAQLPPDAAVLIIGGGPLGALHAELAKARGAKTVIISEISEERIALLSSLKDIITINSTTTDLKEAVFSHTDNLGVHLVIVCAPTNDAHEQSLEYVRKNGNVCFFASLPMDRAMININSRTIHYNELKVYGVSDSRPEHVATALELMAQGKIDAEQIITHQLPMSDFEEGLRLMSAGESLKVILRP